MVKRIIWTSNANHTFKKILEYYVERNQSKTYSRKLSHNIHSRLKILAKQPFLGLKTDNENIRVFIHDNFKIFYQTDENTLIVHFIWDCRQNPETFVF